DWCRPASRRSATKVLRAADRHPGQAERRHSAWHAPPAILTQDEAERAGVRAMNDRPPATQHMTTGRRAGGQTASGKTAADQEEVGQQAAGQVLKRRDEEGVAWLTLNRPAARNALSMGLMAALDAELTALAGNKAVKVVVIGGAGPAFCAGHDLREIRANPAREAYEAVFALCSRLMQRIVHLPQPVIARVHGVATAAGCQLVATCDLAVAADTAQFATPGVNIGLFCSTPMVALSRAVHRKAAMEMLLTGEMVDAARARDL